MSVREQVTKAGDWLYEQLRAAGASRELSTDICFATGQRQAMLDPGEDPWAVAREALERYKRGEWDRPGDELADRLLKEKFGDPMDLPRMLDWLVSKRRL